MAFLVEGGFDGRFFLFESQYFFEAFERTAFEIIGIAIQFEAADFSFGGFRVQFSIIDCEQAFEGAAVFLPCLRE